MICQTEPKLRRRSKKTAKPEETSNYSRIVAHSPFDHHTEESHSQNSVFPCVWPFAVSGFLWSRTIWCRRSLFGAIINHSMPTRCVKILGLKVGLNCLQYLKKNYYSKKFENFQNQNVLSQATSGQIKLGDFRNSLAAENNFCKCRLVSHILTHLHWKWCWPIGE